MKRVTVCLLIIVLVGCGVDRDGAPERPGSVEVFDPEKHQHLVQEQVEPMSLGIAMLLAGDDRPIDLDVLLKELATHWPDLPAATDAQADGTTLSFQLGATGVVLAQMPAPVPWSELEGPCETALLWPDASEDVRRHKFHWIVTVMGNQSPVELSTRLTQVMAAAAAACPSTMGVYWGNARMLIHRDIFVEFAQKVLQEEPTLLLWVDFRVGWDGEGTSGGFTTGMQALGHREFEAEHAPEPPSELRDRFMGLADYVLQHGPVIRNGDTVGNDEHERIRAVYAPSAFGGEAEVIRLEFGPARTVRQ
jgi:hypothetical protein